MHDLRVTFLFPKLLFNTTFRHICYMIVAFCFLSCRMCPWKTQRFHSFIRSRLHWSIEASFAWCEMGRQAPLPHCRQQGEPIRRGMEEFLVHQLFTQIPASKSVTFKNSPTPMWPPYESLPRIDNGGAPVACKILMLLLQTRFGGIFLCTSGMRKATQIRKSFQRPKFWVMGFGWCLAACAGAANTIAF